MSVPSTMNKPAPVDETVVSNEDEVYTLRFRTKGRRDATKLDHPPAFVCSAEDDDASHEEFPNSITCSRGHSPTLPEPSNVQESPAPVSTVVLGKRKHVDTPEPDLVPHKMVKIVNDNKDKDALPLDSSCSTATNAGDDKVAALTVSPGNDSGVGFTRQTDASSANSLETHAVSPLPSTSSSSVSASPSLLPSQEQVFSASNGAIATSRLSITNTGFQKKISLLKGTLTTCMACKVARCRKVLLELAKLLERGLNKYDVVTVSTPTIPNGDWTGFSGISQPLSLIVTVEDPDNSNE